METTMSERAKAVMDARRLIPSDRTDLFQLEMQASSQKDGDSLLAVTSGEGPATFSRA